MRVAMRLATGLSLACGYALADEAGQSCKTSHNLVGACFTVHGRLFEAKNRPRIRIDGTGARQIFGILDRQSLAESPELIPATVNALRMAAPAATDIYGDYEICPFEKDTTGSLRAVCIQSASHLIARRR
jgi:hypothetical protein